MRRRKLSGAVQLPCPFCGELGDIPVDEGGGEHQSYVEDCPVCCKPRLVHVEPGEDGEVHVWLERDDG
jgi:Cysteine-rich CPXCG